MRPMKKALVTLSFLMVSQPLLAFCEVGMSSWYGHPYHGRKAANGSIYNMYAMTAAHRTLPFGTRVKVENIKTKQSVVLKITDRGPFAKGRVLDVSKVAAIKLGMIKTGTIPVKITILPKNGLPQETNDLEVAKVEEPARIEVPATDVQPSEVKEQVTEVKAEDNTSSASLEKEQLLKQLNVIVARLKELETEKQQ